MSQTQNSTYTAPVVLDVGDAKALTLGTRYSDCADQRPHRY